MSETQSPNPTPADAASADATDIDRLSPDPLLNRFSRPRTLSYLLLAVLVHALLIGGTSIGYIYDNYVDPEGAAIRRMERTETASPQAMNPPGDSPAAAPSASTDATAAAATDEPPIPDEASPEPPGERDAPIVERITELPAPGETPVDPFDDGILSIEDTN